MLIVVAVAAATGGAEEPRSVELIGTPQQAALLLLFNDTAAEADQPPLPLALGGACRRPFGHQRKKRRWSVASDLFGVDSLAAASTLPD